MKVITIGRSQENDITVNDERVSRNHLQIVQDDRGNVSAIDLDSTNGTFVNGQRVTGTVQLQPNDTVQIGSTKLPWQTYFMAQQPQPVPQSINQPIPVATPPKPKGKIRLIVAMAALVLLLASGGEYWKISHDKKVKTEQAEQAAKAADEAKADAIAKQKAIEEFNSLKQKAITAKAAELTINTLLSRMKEIAKKYPEETDLQNTIKKLED
jgi:hypothetical protein